VRGLDTEVHELKAGEARVTLSPRKSGTWRSKAPPVDAHARRPEKLQMTNEKNVPVMSYVPARSHRRTVGAQRAAGAGLGFV
jgi:hypothetical protein